MKRRLTPGGVLMVWVPTLEQMNTLATVFPYAKMECSLYGLGSDRPLTRRRDVEAVIRAAFPPKSVEAIRRRRQLCPYEEVPLVHDGAIPVLEDRSSVVHRGRPPFRFIVVPKCDMGATGRRSTTAFEEESDGAGA